MIWKIWKKSKLDSEKIWKIQKKSKLNSEKIGKIWKKGKLNSEKIWKIWRKSKLKSGPLLMTSLPVASPRSTSNVASAVLIYYL
jgi:hypothetical protein